MADSHRRIVNDLNEALADLRFGPPVTHVYNPLIYARKPYLAYAERYGEGPKTVLFLGMNPGPFGMAQTGVPFGEVAAVTDWMKIVADVDQPQSPHPKRPVDGFDCKRSEVSGRRLWGWARDTWQTPSRFFKNFFVANYCPLVFMEESGRNRTPNSLPVAERRPLEAVCDTALQRLVALLAPKWVVGVGAFAADRAAAALDGMDVRLGRVSHPSPANPAANRGWAALVEKELTAMGIPTPSN